MNEKKPLIITIVISSFIVLSPIITLSCYLQIQC